MAYLRLRRSLKIAPGLRLNLTKTGVGLTVGGRGAHYTVHSSGRRTASVGVPGTGAWVQSTRTGRGESTGFRFRRTIPIAPGVRATVTHRGVGVSVGAGGVHRSVTTTGSDTTSVDLPGAGGTWIRRRRHRRS